MKRKKSDFARPYVLRDFEFVRAGPEGAYWSGADGLVVRVAAPEPGRASDAEPEWRHTPRAEFGGAHSRSGAT